MPPKVACGLPLPSGTLALSIQEVPASPAPFNSERIIWKESPPHQPCAWCNSRTTLLNPQNQAPQPSQGKESIAPTASWVYLHHNLCVGGQGEMPGRPLQDSPPQSSPPPAGSKARQQRGGTSSSTGKGAGSVPGRTGLWLPRHYRRKQAPASGAGEEAGVTFSSKGLVSLQGSREDSGM